MNNPAPTRKPRDDELDVFGLTHPGNVRPNNEDQFLVATIHKRFDVLSTSLPDRHRLTMSDERLAVLLMVADGVGGLAGLRFIQFSNQCEYYPFNTDQ